MRLLLLKQLQVPADRGQYGAGSTWAQARQPEKKKAFPPFLFVWLMYLLSSEHRRIP